MDIQKIARSIAKKYKSTNPFQIAKERHIIVNYVPLGRAMGYHCYGYRQHFIILNQELDEFWARFVCAHELGHIILHPHVNTAFLLRSTLFSVDKIEKQANRFAIELLTAESSFWCQQDDSMTVRECAAQYGIPREFEELLAFYQ